MASVMGVWAFCQTILHTIFPPEFRFAFLKFFHKFFNFFTSYCYYDITEIDGVNTNELYNAVQLYLSSSAATSANRLSLNRSLNSSSITFGLSNNDRLVDSYNGVKVVWEHVITQRQTQSFSWRPLPEEKRGFILRAKKKDKTVVLVSYLDFIMEMAKDLRRKHQDRLLYTNSHGGSLDSRGQPWESVPFKHPSTFETLAMDPLKKAEIMADLLDFTHGESFYQRTGRAWKRGYLLYGPPGTGKSSMIAAMANYLGYDIYDVELTEVNKNSELRKLLMKTSSKSIIVIEDIDCSINLTNRNKNGVGKINYNVPSLPGSNRGEDGGNTITLSGLLNFTDGLWSCCGNERIFVFTTNHIEKLDPALLRSGRMDMHIHMSYCSFSALKILFKNYLGCEDDQLDGVVLKELEGVIDDAEMTPADISEVLIKNRHDKDNAVRELLEALKTKAKRNGMKSRERKTNEDEDKEHEKRALDSPKQDCDLLQESSNKCEEKDDENNTINKRL
ncbi:P-loop containing nucleoside triphosphate hydrolase superfamily protein [Forsythia ovata]|uniref:P-loop containing nucleoside triphosphate hydrolase superfamily protein n=1 Tax=Forsythia ovata TaxID=205694 RepID=A0ABD1PKD9_9LAMI